VVRAASRLHGTTSQKTVIFRIGIVVADEYKEISPMMDNVKTA
jgi:hypothetical protein